MNLRNHQEAAIQVSLNNNFLSGVHSHATGTGKSLIALNIALKFHKFNPEQNILWLWSKKLFLINCFLIITLNVFCIQFNSQL